MDVNRKRRIFAANELVDLPKEDLIERIKQLTVYNEQLKNIANRTSSVQKVARKGRPFDFSKCSWRKILLKFYYLGWDYQGFASQESSTATIEHHIFEALTRTCLIKDRESSNYHRCGRTDKGVSAFCQVISINVRSKFGAETIAEDTSIKNEMPYCRLLNRVLPPEIRCIAWKPLKNPNFSARFDCIQRTYRYFFPRGSLDIAQMQEACTHLLGVHDFRNLCKMDVANGVITFIRSIDAAQIHSASGETGSSAFDMMYLEIKGRAFLWHQIRCIMAVLLLVGEGKEKPMVVQQLLDIQAHPKKPQYSLAKDSPLNLYDVQYRDYSEETNKEAIATGATPILEDSDWIHDTDDLGRVISELQRQWTDTAVKQEMMRSMVRDLSELVPQEVRDQHLDLTEGVKAKKYIPLLERQTCESLEERIDHYVKKKRLVLSE